MPVQGPHICPNCGERVTMFAAGCALCGAALDPRCAQGPPTLGQRLRSAWFARPRLAPRAGALTRRIR